MSNFMQNAVSVTNDKVEKTADVTKYNNQILVEPENVPEDNEWDNTAEYVDAEVVSMSDEEETEQYYSVGDLDCFVFLCAGLTNLRCYGSILSLAIVTSNNDALYIEIDDEVDMKRMTSFAFENIYKKTILNGEHGYYESDIETDTTIRFKGNKLEAREAIIRWLNKYLPEKPIQFVVDGGHLEFAMLYDLLSSPNKVEIDDEYSEILDRICQIPFDINYSFSSLLYRQKPINLSKEEFDNGYVSLKAALTIDRNELAEEFGVPVPSDQCFTLFNANIIKAIFNHFYNKTEDENNKELSENEDIISVEQQITEEKDTK